MNNNVIPHILAKSGNCFYILLDKECKIVSANAHFIKKLNGENHLAGNSFFSFFSENQQTRWRTVFDSICVEIENHQTLSSPLSTTNETRQFNWDVTGTINAEKTLTGFEILGVLCEKVFDNTDLTTPDSKLKSVFNKLKKIVDLSMDMICAIDENGRFTKVSAASKNILGYEPREMKGKYFADFISPDDLQRTLAATEEIKSGPGTTDFENTYYRKDGSSVPLTWSSRWEEADKKFYAVARDATSKKAAENALKVSEEKYRILFYNHPLPMWIYDTATFRFLEVNEAAVELLGYTRTDFLEMSLQAFLVQREGERFNDLYRQNDYYTQKHKGMWTHRKKNGEEVILEITSNATSYENRNAKIVLAIDRTEKIKAEEELIKSNERYLFLSQATFDAIWDWNLVTGEVHWNEGVKKMFDIPNAEDISGKNWWYNNLHDDDRERVITKLNDHIHQQIPQWDDEYRFKNGDDNYIHVYDRAYTVYDENEKAVRMIGAMQDLTERKAYENTLQKLNVSLEKRARELAESNTELERFAYVASHDLQEPLRMVTSFLQLLEKRYKDRLDQKAHEYIGYAVDGAERMKKLILDLLEYSRVNSSKIEKEDVDLNEVIGELKHVYKNALFENEGSIINGTLPVVKGNKTQLLQLFQNITGNAFKYKSEKPPVVTISYTEDTRQFEFSISDNGIGIDPKFFNKIFIIFQRLHNREQYSGTGIGLAICKKIVDKHGGRIWVNSLPGHGSTFYFTLPKSQ